MELIKKSYGKNLEEIEKNICQIIREYFLDKDGLIYSYINKNTLLPFKNKDPEVNVVPVNENWIAGGKFPCDFKHAPI